MKPETVFLLERYYYGNYYENGNVRVIEQKIYYMIFMATLFL